MGVQQGPLPGHHSLGPSGIKATFPAQRSQGLALTLSSPRPAVSRAEQGTHQGYRGTGPVIPATLDEHDVGSLVERATCPGPGTTRMPWSEPSGGSRLGGRGCEAPMGSSGLRPGAVAPSDARRLELSTGSARQGTVLVSKDAGLPQSHPTGTGPVHTPVGAESENLCLLEPSQGA